jgi:quercetin 2,3-dioxygenase
LDYAGPENFSPSEKRRGVGAHPHRGFETVTISYSGEVEHRDSSGAGGTIRAGDVQWMTAASGVVMRNFTAQTMPNGAGRSIKTSPMRKYRESNCYLGLGLCA